MKKNIFYSLCLALAVLAMPALSYNGPHAFLEGLRNLSLYAIYFKSTDSNWKNTLDGIDLRTTELAIPGFGNSNDPLSKIHTMSDTIIPWKNYNAQITIRSPLYNKIITLQSHEDDKKVHLTITDTKTQQTAIKIYDTSKVYYLIIHPQGDAELIEKEKFIDKKGTCVCTPPLPGYALPKNAQDPLTCQAAGLNAPEKTVCSLQ